MIVESRSILRDEVNDAWWLGVSLSLSLSVIELAVKVNFQVKGTTIIRTSTRCSKAVGAGAGKFHQSHAFYNDHGSEGGQVTDAVGD